jgi:endonuclease/exonuclease/phosphatase family metal-dependent hydrolase
MVSLSKNAVIEAARARLKPRKLVKLIAGFAILELLVLPIVACDPFNTQFEDVEDAVYYEAHTKRDVPPPAGQVLVMNWNAKFGGGRIDFWFDCIGDRVEMTKEEVIANMEGLARKINQVDPDIILLQEIDINSKRAAYVDQVQWLLDNTNLNYGVYASQWKADFIPTDGIGRVDSGNAILSKYPLTDAQRIQLPQMPQDAVTQYFYLKRNILSTKIDLPGLGPLHVLNVHTDAYSKDDTKKKQIDRFKAELDRINAAGGLFIGGGDLNTLPPGSERQVDFPDSVCEDEDFIADDYREEADWLVSFYEDYDEVVSLEDYQADNGPYFTHTVDKDMFWNRKLDYLFTNGRYLPGSGLTHQDTSSGGMETMPLSDHAPISVVLLLEMP